MTPRAASPAALVALALAVVAPTTVLAQNYPNPTTGVTSVSFTLPTAASVTMSCCGWASRCSRPRSPHEPGPRLLRGWRGLKRLKKKSFSKIRIRWAKVWGKGLKRSKRNILLW